MKRFIWIAVIFGGGIAALMIAGVMLMQQTAHLGPAHNLRAAVMEVRKVLLEWDVDTIRNRIGDRMEPVFPQEAYRQLFDDAHAEDRVQKARFETFLSLLDSFPTIRFNEEDADVRSVMVHYSIKDQGCEAALEIHFSKLEGRGWIAWRIKPQLTTPGGWKPTEFVPGKTPPLKDIFDQVFKAAYGTDLALFQKLVAIPQGISASRVKTDLNNMLNDHRVGHDRVLKLLPVEMSPLPRGTQSLEMFVAGVVRGQGVQLHFLLDPLEPPKFTRLEVLPLNQEGQIQSAPIEQPTPSPDNQPGSTGTPPPDNAPAPPADAKSEDTP